jgi:hypothetical protein
MEKYGEIIRISIDFRDFMGYFLQKSSVSGLGMSWDDLVDLGIE